MIAPPCEAGIMYLTYHFWVIINSYVALVHREQFIVGGINVNTDIECLLAHGTTQVWRTSLKGENHWCSAIRWCSKWQQITPGRPFISQMEESRLIFFVSPLYCTPDTLRAYLLCYLSHPVGGAVAEVWAFGTPGPRHRAEEGGDTCSAVDQWQQFIPAGPPFSRPSRAGN